MRFQPSWPGSRQTAIPSTELSFEDRVRQATIWPWKGEISYKTAMHRVEEVLVAEAIAAGEPVHRSPAAVLGIRVTEKISRAA